MASLIYYGNTSLDGFIEDEDGAFDWTEPGEEQHRFINDLVRPTGTFLHGRLMYETMAPWETDPGIAESSPTMRDFAEIWKGADKVVYSTTLQSAPTARTRIERTFDPDAIRHMKESAERDLTIGGSALAAQAFRAGLIDECWLFLAPIIVGGGKPALPAGVRLGLELVNERRFDGGMVFLHYRTSADA